MHTTSATTNAPASMTNDNAHAPASPLTRQGLSVFNIVLNYGLAESFFLGSALYHLLQAAVSTSPRVDLEAAKAMVDVEAAREDAHEPLADETALAWATPEIIAKAYALTGSHAAAVELLLESCAFEIEEQVDPDTGVAETVLERLSDLIVLAIDELPTTGAAV